MQKIQEIIVKSIITKSKLPDVDFVVNPYTGCQFACAYCYASFMGRFVNESIENWGNYVYVKTNAVTCFEKEYHKLINKNGSNPSVLLSSVTDAYQPIEKKYQLTRGILEIFNEYKYSGLISILTKSPLVLRDTDILKQLKNVEVGVTITADNDFVSNDMEMSAPSIKSRLDTLKYLAESGINTYAFIGPLLPHYIFREGVLDKLIAAIAQAQVKSVYIEHLNSTPYIWQRIKSTLKSMPQDAQLIYANAYNNGACIEYRDKIDTLIYKLLQQYGIQIRLGKTLHHVLDSNQKTN